MRGVERPVEFLVHPQSFANSNETSWDFLVPLDCSLCCCHDTGRLCPKSSHIYWLAFSKASASPGSPETGSAKWFRCYSCLDSILSEWELPWANAGDPVSCSLLLVLLPPRHWVVCCPVQFWRKPGELRFLVILVIGSKVGFTDPTYIKWQYLLLSSLGGD